jgi:hypothetical protein
MKMSRRFHVNDQAISAGLLKGVDVPFRLFDHEVDVERQPGGRAQRLYKVRPKGDIGHEAPIHDIQVEAVGSASLRLFDLIGKPAKVGGQD